MKQTTLTCAAAMVGTIAALCVGYGLLLGGVIKLPLPSSTHQQRHDQWDVQLKQLKEDLDVSIGRASANHTKEHFETKDMMIFLMEMLTKPSHESDAQRSSTSNPIQQTSKDPQSFQTRSFGVGGIEDNTPVHHTQRTASKDTTLPKEEGETKAPLAAVASPDINGEIAENSPLQQHPSRQTKDSS